MEFSESNSKRIKRCLSQIIPKEESVLEFVTAKLSIYDYQESEFVPLDTEGILCVVINRIKSCLYLQLFDIIEFKNSKKDLIIPFLNPKNINIAKIIIENISKTAKLNLVPP